MATIKIKNAERHVNDAHNRINNWSDRYDVDGMSDKALRAYEAKIREGKRQLARAQTRLNETLVVDGD